MFPAFSYLANLRPFCYIFEEKWKKWVVTWQNGALLKLKLNKKSPAFAYFADFRRFLSFLEGKMFKKYKIGKPGYVTCYLKIN